MAKIKDLTPKLSKAIPTAEVELSLDPGVTALGARAGGVNMYSNVFKRGYGDAVFGSDENGIWLGAADFPDAPFRVSMNGDMVMTSSDGQSIIISSANNTIIVNDGVNDRVLIGFQAGGF